jgi:hypothetical protein
MKKTTNTVGTKKTKTSQIFYNVTNYLTGYSKEHFHTVTLAPPAALQLWHREGAVPAAMVTGAPPLSTSVPSLLEMDHEI